MRSLEDYREGLSQEVQVQMTSPAAEAFSLATTTQEWEDLNKYELAEKLVTKDPDLAAVLDMMASQIQSCYNGIFIRPGKELDDDEQAVVNWAQKFAMNHDFADRMFTVSKKLLMFGDCIYLKQRGGANLSLQMLPIHHMTILESVDQKMDLTAQVFKPNFYIMNENSTEKEKIFKKDQIVHFSLEKEGSQVEDLRSRYTFGVWSHSPVDSLKLLALWRKVNIMDDIQWRHANVPREVHKVDVSHITPEKFEGTIEERLKKAKGAVEDELDTYQSGIEEKEVDQGYITTQDVEIDYLEPRSTNYVAPNELIAEIENLYAARFGMPASVMGAGRVRQYVGEVVTSAYSTMRARQLAQQIANQFLEFLKEEARIQTNFSDELLDKLKVNIKLVLDKDKYAVARQVSILAETGAFTRNELREMMGYQPLDDDELGEELAQGNPLRRRTPAQEREYARRTGPETPPPITPESKEDTLEPR